MDVQLISYPNVDADQLCGLAAAKCTGSSNYEASLKGALSSGHESVAEHAVFTFEIFGVSRVLLTQLTRHRLASYSVESQRYVQVKDAAYVVPQTINHSEEDNEKYREYCKKAYNLYLRLIENGIPEEDARYILPQGVTTDLVVTMNARELRHFFALRGCRRAQWEIREMADRMYLLVLAVAPGLFKDAGPGCIRGQCPEGSRSCGDPRTDFYGPAIKKKPVRKKK